MARVTIGELLAKKYSLVLTVCVDICLSSAWIIVIVEIHILFVNSVVFLK